MKHHVWDENKNVHLQETRGISFETVISQIDQGLLLDVIINPSMNHKGQNMYVIEFNDYVYLVPFSENKDRVFLITIIPNRQATKKYLKGGNDNA